MRLGSLFCVCLCMLLLSGCEKGPRREGLGGGATAPVSVKLMFDEAPEKEVEPVEPAPAPTTFGGIQGRVTLAGTESQIEILASAEKMIRGAKCGGKPVPDRSLLVGEGGGVANVLVYLKHAPAANKPAPPEPVTVLIKDCQFSPRMSIARVGQKVKFTTEDGLACKVVLAGAAKAFSGDISAKSSSVETDYSQAEPYPVSVTSPTYPFMQGYQLAVDHPWATVTNADGTFEIQGAPSGSHEFIFWHEKVGPLSQKVVIDVPAGGVAEKTLEIPARVLLKP